MPTISEKRSTFRDLHKSGCFVMPNPWDAGGARYLQSLGFKAIASTSIGFAFTQGSPDNGVPRDVMLQHLRALVEASDLPVNADFENGHSASIDGVGESVRLCVETGVAGLSIEDSTGDAANPLFDIETAVARLKSARAAIDKAGGEVTLTARAENFFAGRPDLEDAIARLTAYADAGADCLYAPGIRTREQIERVVAAAGSLPVNVLVGSASEFSVADLAAMGVRRISVGGGLAMTAWNAFVQGATRLAEGNFDGLLRERPAANLNAFFREDRATRGF